MVQKQPGIPPLTIETKGKLRIDCIEEKINKNKQPKYIQEHNDKQEVR